MTPARLISLRKELAAAIEQSDVQGARSAWESLLDAAAAMNFDQAAFARTWVPLASSLMDCGQFTQAFDLIEKAIAEGLIKPQDLPLLAQVRDLAVRHAAVFRDSETVTAGLLRGDPMPAVPADLAIRGWLRFLNPANPAPHDARRIWLTVVTQTMAIAAERNLQVLLVPEFLSTQPVTKAGGRTLSFHSHGVGAGTWHFKPADLPGHVLIDRGGYSGWSSIAGRQIEEFDLPPAGEAVQFFAAHREAVLMENVSKYPQKPISAEAALPAMYVFVPLQVANDRTQQKAYLPMPDMLRLVVARFAGTGIKVVVKRHPKCRSPDVAALIDDLHGRGDILLSDASIHVLLARALAVITVNSGVGSESMIHEKPLYLFGAADYGAVAHHIHSEAEFRDATTPIRPAVSGLQLKRFLAFYRTRYQVQVTDETALRDRLAHTLFAPEDIDQNNR